MNPQISLTTVMTASILLMMSCAPHYLSSNFDSKTADHEIVAVVPIEMVFTGKIPEDWTEEDVLNVEEAESQAFQISFYNEILRSTKSGSKPLWVDIQHYKKTLQLLEEHDIGIRESWKMAPEELANLLEVDAVVMARIEKNRFMSDLESYGIEVATEVINILTNYRLFLWMPVSSQSKEVIADHTLLNGEDGVTLWSVSFKVGADWRQPTNQIIDEISRKAAKKFPYRL